MVGGTVRPEAPSYVERTADRELLEHAAAGEFCYVLTPRQMGKLSLMECTAIELRKKKAVYVIIALQGIVARGMSAEAFYAGLVDAFIRQGLIPDDWLRLIGFRVVCVPIDLWTLKLCTLVL